MSQAQINFEVTDAAIAKSFENAASAWCQVALASIRTVALSRPRFTADDVAEAMSAFDVHTHDKRAMGAMFRRAAKAGWIRGTGEYIRCARVNQNQCPKQVWASLIFGGAQ